MDPIMVHYPLKNSPMDPRKNPMKSSCNSTTSHGAPANLAGRPSSESHSSQSRSLGASRWSSPLRTPWPWRLAMVDSSWWFHGDFVRKPTINEVYSWENEVSLSLIIYIYFIWTITGRVSIDHAIYNKTTMFWWLNSYPFMVKLGLVCYCFNC